MPPPPTFLASSRIQPAKKSSSVICAGSVSRVLIRGPLASNAMTVGTDEMTYAWPKPARMMSGASYSTVVSATPPSGSPAPDSTSEWRMGETMRQVGHQEVVQRVSRGTREEAERRW